MADMTREQLRQELKNQGEDAPRQWTKVELRLRLEEMTGEPWSTSKTNAKGEKSDYEKMVVRLNTASRRKSDLLKFCETQLKMANLESYTIPRIQQLAMAKIYEVSESDPRDKIGFGKYTDVSYGEIQELDSNYCTWVQETVRSEGREGCCHRMVRLANWLNKQSEEEMRPDGKPTGKHVPPRRGGRRSTATSSNNIMDPATREYLQATEGRMAQMMDAIENLRDEMVALKGEPTRKKDNKHDESTDMTDSAYSLVASPKSAVSPQKMPQGPTSSAPMVKKK